MSNYTRFPDPASGIKIYPSAANFPVTGQDGQQAVAADTNTIYVYDTSVPGWQPVANPGSVVAITALMSDVTATGPGAVNATVNSVGGAAAVDIATSVSDTQAATDANVASTLVKRDASGSFAAEDITAENSLIVDAGTGTTSTVSPGSIVSVNTASNEQSTLDNLELEIVSPGVGETLTADSGNVILDVTMTANASLSASTLQFNTPSNEFASLSAAYLSLKKDFVSNDGLTINTANSGVVQFDGVNPAAYNYVFDFISSNTYPAQLKTNWLTLKDNMATEVTIVPVNGTSSYSIALPSALPAATSALLVDSSGFGSFTEVTEQATASTIASRDSSGNSSFNQVEAVTFLSDDGVNSSAQMDYTNGVQVTNSGTANSILNTTSLSILANGGTTAASIDAATPNVNLEDANTGLKSNLSLGKLELYADKNTPYSLTIDGTVSDQASFILADDGVLDPYFYFTAVNNPNTWVQCNNFKADSGYGSSIAITPTGLALTNNSQTLTINSNPAATGTYSITLPPDQGAASTFLKNDGAGNLSWGVVDLSNLANRSLSNLTAPTALNAALLAGNGIVSAPSYSFTSSPNTGMWYDPAGILRFSYNGVTQLSISANTVQARDILSCVLLNAGGINPLAQFQVTEAFNMTTDVITPFTTRSGAWGRSFGSNLNYSFLRPLSIDATRILRVGKKISNSTHYAATLSVTLPDTISPGNTGSTSNGTTLHFAQVGQQNLGWTAGVGTTFELAGLGEARVTSVTLGADPLVYIVDKDLGGAAVANKAVTIKQDLASFRLADGTEKFRIDPSGNTAIKGDSSLDGALVVNEAGADKDMRVEGDTDVNLLFTDASADKVGIGTNTPAEKLDVSGTAQATAFQVPNYILSPQLYDSGTQTADFALDLGANGPCQQATINAAGPLILTLSNPVTGGAYLLKIVQGATPGTLTWPVNVKWGSAGAPTLSAVTGKIDIINLYYDGTDYYGTYALGF